MVQKKLKFAFVSLTSCEGCYVELLGLRERFVELKDKIDIVEFRLFEDDYFFSEQKLDVVFVEGSPVTKENIINLKKIRSNAKHLVACGSCAHLGGIYHLKNYQDSQKIMEHIYSGDKKLDNPPIKPLAEYVKVDLNLPTCPIIKEEILRFIYSLVVGKVPKIKQNPVCFECMTNGYECLLQKGEICLGPIIQGGCNAICLKSKQACWGCRGLLKKPAIVNWKNAVKNNGWNEKQINKVLEMFAIKEFINK